MDRSRIADIKKSLLDIDSKVDYLIGNIMFLIDDDSKTKEEFDEEMKEYLKVNHEIRDLTKLISLIVDVMEMENRATEKKLELIKDLLNKVQ